MLNGNRRAVIFLGNSLFGDDAIGLAIAEKLKTRLMKLAFDVYAVERTGFALLDYLEGYEEAIIVDSVSADHNTPGSVQSYRLKDFKLVKPASPHYAGVPEALELMETLQMKIPEIRIIGISIQDPYALSDSLSEGLRIGIEAIAEKVYDQIAAEAT